MALVREIKVMDFDRVHEIKIRAYGYTHHRLLSKYIIVINVGVDVEICLD